VAKTHVKRATCVAFVCSCLLGSITYNQIDSFGLPETFFGQNLHGYYTVYNNYYDQANEYWWNGYFEFVNSAIIKNLIPKLRSTIPIILGLVIVRDIFSYFLFCFLNLVIDVMTVQKLRESLKEKVRLSSVDKRDELSRAERRSVFMVVVNSIVNIVLRVPELLGIVFFVTVSGVARNFRG
jgi:hypothetical protein